MSTETLIKRRMMAELLFQNALDMQDAVAELAKLGFTVRILDWIDPAGSQIVWVLAFTDNGLDQGEFFGWVSDVVEPFRGEVVEAGFAPDDVEAWIAAKS